MTRHSKGAHRAGLVVAILTLVCCGGSIKSIFNGDDSGTPAAPATPAAAAPTTTTPTGPAQEICRATEGGGSYYLNVTSAVYRNLSACAAAKPYRGTIDNLLALPGMDRRCILGDAYTNANHALVGVYSDRKAADLAAARAFCAANGGTN